MEGILRMFSCVPLPPLQRSESERESVRETYTFISDNALQQHISIQSFLSSSLLVRELMGPHAYFPFRRVTSTAFQPGTPTNTFREFWHISIHTHKSLSNYTFCIVHLEDMFPGYWLVKMDTSRHGCQNNDVPLFDSLSS